MKFLLRNYNKTSGKVCNYDKRDLSQSQGQPVKFIKPVNWSMNNALA